MSTEKRSQAGEQPTTACAGLAAPMPQAERLNSDIEIEARQLFNKANDARRWIDLSPSEREGWRDNVRYGSAPQEASKPARVKGDPAESFYMSLPSEIPPNQQEASKVEPVAELSEAVVLAAITACSGWGKVSLTYESGPYDIDRPTNIAMCFARAIQAAIGRKSNG